MSGGVVWAYKSGDDPNQSGMYGEAVSLDAGDVIPFGRYYVQGTWTLTTDDGTVHNLSGYCESDGQSCKMGTGGGMLIPIGAGPNVNP